jgi:hypothetical protein
LLESGRFSIITRRSQLFEEPEEIAAPLPDPVVDLYNNSGTHIAADNDWKDSQEVALEASGLSPSDSREAAIMSALAPGAYTAIVRSHDDTSGVALVEVYDLH